MIESLYPSAEKEMSSCPATLSYADLLPAVQYQPIHHADSFTPSILPLFVMSELVMNFTDFLDFFGDKECTVVPTKCGKLLSLRTSWESDMVLLWSCKGFGKNIIEETLHYHSSRFEVKFGKSNLFSLYTHGEISLLLVSDSCPGH